MLADDDLTRPLGLEQRAPRRRPPAAAVGYGIAFVCVAAVAATYGVVRYRAGAAATTDIVRIEAPRPGDVTGSVSPPPAASQPAPPPPSEKRVLPADEVEGSSGVTVVRGGGAAPPGAVVIQVPRNNRIVLAAAPDARLIERSKFGGLPKIGPADARPSRVYARPFRPDAEAAARPKVAVVVNGLGINAAGTAEAVAKLPSEMTLAFAPYGDNLERAVADARAEGHEVMLQVPMEPFDFKENDTGPHTLMAGLTERDNLDRLHRLMARFPGYVGITNFQGARFTAEAAALSPVLKDIGGRGLLFLDDGSSARSLVGDLSRGLGLEAARSDVFIDPLAKTPAIERDLARLEEIARARGVAIASASALPATVARLESWSRDLAARGIQLVPLTAAMAARRN